MPSAPTTALDHGQAPSDLFGHPRGLSYLFATEMWERFSYYGMRALLVLYMVKYLLQPEQAHNVVGLATLKAAFEFVFGPLGVQPLGSLIYGSYTSLVYLTPLIGGWLADRVFGQRRMVVFGATLMAVGHFMMAFEALFLFALTALILGSGAFKPNTTAQVGGLYAPGDRRRDRAYSIFYVGINIGAFFSPLVCGTLGEIYGWHYGFSAAGVGMLIGLLVYLRATPSLPPDELHKARLTHEENKPLTAADWRAIAALMALFVPTTVFWATYEQSGNTISLWADEFADRMIYLGTFTFVIPVTWFQALNPFMIFAFTPFMLALWVRQAARGREPSTVTKMALGCFGVALANLLMVAAAWQADPAGKASWLWLFPYFVLITLGELYLSPISLSLVSKVAPAKILSLMMAVWLATSFTGNFLAGYLGSFWSGMDKAGFFLMIAALAGGAGVVIAAFNRPLKAVLNE